jgi:hypothetical protein
MEPSPPTTTTNDAAPASADIPELAHAMFRADGSVTRGRLPFVATPEFSMTRGRQ